MAALTSLCPLVVITAARLPVLLRTLVRNRWAAGAYVKASTSQVAHHPEDMFTMEQPNVPSLRATSDHFAAVLVEGKEANDHRPRLSGRLTNFPLSPVEVSALIAGS